jgi:glycosyltransferase involved in cell wall biosynthesis
MSFLVASPLERALKAEMRIARFNTGTILSSWSYLAVAATLRSLGHEVIEGVVPTNDFGAVMYQLTPHQYRRAVAGMPTIEQLKSCDVILVSGPDFVSAWLQQLYGKEEWLRLGACKVAFYLESSGRLDYKTPYEACAEWYDVHFYPDPGDAERFGGHHLVPFVDIEMFKPCDTHTSGDCDEPCRARRAQQEIYDAAFLGSLYTKRVEFLKRLLPLIPEIELRAGGVAVRDLGGERHRDWARLLVSNLRQIKIHVGLPSVNSRMLVARPFETMACGTFLLTYKTDDDLLRDGEHCRIYDPDKPEELAEIIRYYLANEGEREAIAKAGLAETRRNYSSTQRMAEVLEIACPGSNPLPAWSEAPAHQPA